MIYPNAILIFFSISNFFFWRRNQCFSSKACLQNISFDHSPVLHQHSGLLPPWGKTRCRKLGQPFELAFFPRAEKEHCLACWELLVPSPSSLDSPFLGLRLTVTGPGRGALCPGLGLQLQGPRALCALRARMKVCSQPDISLI